MPRSTAAKLAADAASGRTDALLAVLKAAEASLEKGNRFSAILQAGLCVQRASIERTDVQAAYRIAEQLTGWDYFPSVLCVCQQFRVGPKTARRALKDLQYMTGEFKSGKGRSALAAKGKDVLQRLDEWEGARERQALLDCARTVNIASAMGWF